MPDPDNNPTTTTQPSMPGGSTEPGQTPSNPDAATPPPQAPATGGKVITMPTAAMAEIKRKEREKATKAHQAELDRTARSLGYPSHAAMIEQLKSQGSGKGGGQRTSTPRAPAKEPAMPKPEPTESPRTVSRLQKELDRSVEERKRLNRARAHEEKRRRDAERKLEAERAESALRVAAVKAGVKDVDYAIHLLQREVSGKSAADLEGFDEDKFFAEDLRKRAPYLYGVETQPASTAAPAAPNGQTPPAPGAPPKQEPSAPAAIDAKKLSNEEYQALLRKRGLSSPQFGMPS